MEEPGHVVGEHGHILATFRLGPHAEQSSSPVVWGEAKSGATTRGFKPMAAYSALVVTRLSAGFSLLSSWLTEAGDHVVTSSVMTSCGHWSTQCHLQGSWNGYATAAHGLRVAVSGSPSCYRWLDPNERQLVGTVL